MKMGYFKNKMVVFEDIYVTKLNVQMFSLPEPILSLIFCFKQVDINKDRLVTLEEFLRATEKKEFLEPDSWEVMRMYSKCNILYYYHHSNQETKWHVSDLCLFSILFWYVCG